MDIINRKHCNTITNALSFAAHQNVILADEHHNANKFLYRLIDESNRLALQDKQNKTDKSDSTPITAVYIEEKLGNWKCEKCGSLSVYPDSTPQLQNVNYCSRCGAKFDTFMAWKDTNTDSNEIESECLFE
jgi:predicted RNA-binding Zn-ribbon protein involved in translation (DUF1610 family)